MDELTFNEINRLEATKGLDMEQELTGACCACCRVGRRDNNTGGLVTREWWECDLCQTEFVKKTQLIETSKALELLCRFVAGTDRWESKRDEMLKLARRQLGKEKG